MKFITRPAKTIARILTVAEFSLLERSAETRTFVSITTFLIIFIALPWPALSPRRFHLYPYLEVRFFFADARSALNASMPLFSARISNGMHRSLTTAFAKTFMAVVDRKC